MAKIIFITGGVVSSIGKGISASSLGAILKAHHLSVSILKMDPYINVDPGTMSPYQHGEVFVTEDGTETDLDLGHYERFLNQNLSQKNNFTTGQIYNSVIKKERKGEYLGATVQVIPHITDEIQKRIQKLAEQYDILIAEIGGTVGDIESLPFLESIRQTHLNKHHQCLFIHVTLLPFLKTSSEFKTKPTQHSVKELRSIGIQPNMIICRCTQNIPESEKQKIALFTNVQQQHIFSAPDAPNIYQIPLIFHKQKLDQHVLNYFNIPYQMPNLKQWETLQNKIQHLKHQINIAIIGKYTKLTDAYLSIQEALYHAATHQNIHLNITYMDADNFNNQHFDAILIPGGFGERSTLGKIKAIEFARKKNIPILGICFGMQLMTIEFARNVLNMKTANSVEIDPNTKTPLFQPKTQPEHLGGTMRLGDQTILIADNTQASNIYKQNEIKERHRHRYEFNNTYLNEIEKHKLIVSGKSKNESLAEIIELKDHPFFIGCQFHPEFNSKPHQAHPLFLEFIKKALEHAEKST